MLMEVQDSPLFPRFVEAVNNASSGVYTIVG